MLRDLRYSNPQGLEYAVSRSRPNQSSIEDLFSPRPSPKRFNLAAPFLLSVALEALKLSRFSERVKLVPGEADAYCADFVTQNGGIVLSGDSDILVHLERGKVAPFSDLRLAECDHCNSPAFHASVLDPKSIANRLQISSLKRLAFEVYLNNVAPFEVAVRNAQIPMTPAKNAMFDGFIGAYDSELLKTDATQKKLALIESMPHLDIGLSHLVLQIRYPSEWPICIFLPSLLEDATKLNAWDLSSSLRRFSYSLMFLDAGTSSTRPIFEHSRQSNELEVMNAHECVAFAERLNQQLDDMWNYSEGLPSAASWRALALSQVLSWYQDMGNPIPVKDLLDQMLGGSTVGGVWSWHVIHFEAQMQAFLYSLRQLKQILHCNVESIHPAIATLAEVLRTFPSFHLLMPTQGQGKRDRLAEEEFNKLGKRLLRAAEEMQRTSSSHTVINEDYDAFEPPRTDEQIKLFANANKVKVAKKPNRFKAIEEAKRQWAVEDMNRTKAIEEVSRLKALRKMETNRIKAMEEAKKFKALEETSRLKTLWEKEIKRTKSTEEAAKTTGEATKTTEKAGRNKVNEDVDMIKAIGGARKTKITEVVNRI